MSETVKPYQRLFAELKRRHVFRVAAVYGAVGFAVIEFASAIFPHVALPDWTVTLIVWLVLLGFPLALVLAWAFETTPAGRIRRTRSVRPATLDAIAAQPARRRWPVGLAGLIGGALLVGGAWFALGGEESVGETSPTKSRANTTVASNTVTLTVLPFRDLSSKVDRSSFAQGFHADLLTQLYKLRSLNVIALPSTSEYQDSPKKAGEIARELGAAHVLDGAVQSAGDEFRINLQLIDTDSGRQLWADSYSGVLSVPNVLGVQEDIAVSVAEALRAALTEEERESLARVPTRDLEAYQAYQQAREAVAGALEAAGPARLKKAERLLEDAIDRDSAFAEAYALKSVIASQRYILKYDRSQAALVAADSLSRKALELVSGLPEGHAGRARYFAAQLDFDQALRHVEQALSGRPGDAALISLEGWILLRIGEVREALERFLHSARLDPRDGLAAVLVGRTYLLLREYDPARRWLLRARTLRPERGTTYHELSFLELLEDGDIDAARAWLDEARALGVYNPRLGYTYVDLEMVARQPIAAIEAVEAWPEPQNSNQFRHVPQSLAFALAYRLAGDSAAARRHFTVARNTTAPLVERNPNDARYRGALGLALAGLGLEEEAIKQGQRALELLPPGKQLWTGGWRLQELAAIYTMAGRAEEAIEQLDTLLSIPSDLSPALLRIDPIWDPLRDEPEFRALVSQARR